jgi:glycine/D-amino acid oxidase-like deaminating enzyme
MPAVEVAVIGGGVVGCAAAALLAEAGAAVTLYERETIGAGASGRNQGVLQDPLDRLLTPLYRESLALHAETAPELGLDRPPAGLLLLSPDRRVPARLASRLARDHPGVGAELVEEARRVEPGLAPGVAACRLETGHQVPPAAATFAWAERARRGGARIEIGRPATAAAIAADAVLVAAGPWTPEAGAPGVPVGAVWGVTVQVRLDDPPQHALEEAVVEELATLSGDASPAFAAVTAAGVTTLGATFTADEPSPGDAGPAVVARARRFLPSVAAARVVGLRACARPVSPDGYPILGRLPGSERVWLATGNGPWGLTCGPAGARLVVDALLGRGDVPPAFDAARFSAPGL